MEHKQEERKKPDEKPSTVLNRCENKKQKRAGDKYTCIWIKETKCR